MISLNTEEDDRQCDREAVARDVALGRRARIIQQGFLGPVLKRWLNADVAPIADLMRKVAAAYLEGDNAEVALLLDTPTAELGGREKPLEPLMEWLMRGNSPGRSGYHYLDDAPFTSFCDDVALAFLATAVTRCTRKDKDASMSFVLTACAEAMRETILGQFITHIQGAKAMQAVRERNPEIWQQQKTLRRICSSLANKVRPALEAADRERELFNEGVGREGAILQTNARRVVHIIDHKGELRRMSLTEPDAIDWEVMTLCWQAQEDAASGEQFKPLWLAFASMFLAASQRVSGWFDVGEKRQRHGKHIRTTKLLVLSAEASGRIAADAERWVSLGFQAEPMITLPQDGDYLTVKHRKVTGQRAPKGLTTCPDGTAQWTLGACALAETPWCINPYALTAATQAAASALESEPERKLRLGTGGSRGLVDTLRVAEARRLASEPRLYLPTMMDFRGRVYYRPTWINPQGDDLAKSLLRFPLEPGRLIAVEDVPSWWATLAKHFAGLFGGPEKIDKQPLYRQIEWFQQTLKEWDDVKVLGVDYVADKPLTFAAHWNLMQAEETDTIPIQLDGTCNGLQHLSALTRDYEGARHVNLTTETRDAPPADIYGVVASLATVRLEEARWWVDASPKETAWADRLWAAGIVPDRKLCKQPVMVLPYGGTREAVRLAIKAAVLDRLSSSPSEAQDCPWRSYQEDGYGAFKDRQLAEHPLFNSDVGLLSALVWDCIGPAIPRAMSAMATLQAIGKWVGDYHTSLGGPERALSWRVGVGRESERLWVTQAKSKAQQKRLTMRGFHLPDMVRRLTLNAHSNEVDPKAHRTGIVANFIHSQDAAHLAHTIALFRERGGLCVGSVHDMVMVRPSEADLMGRCLREAFVALYEEDPLSQPVRLLTAKGAIDREFASWHELAEAAGVAFPDRGSFDITEVMGSQWFFS